LNVRSLLLWKDFEKQVGKKLFFNSGVLWMCYTENTPLVDDSIPFSQKHRMEYEYLSRTDLEKRYPSIHSVDLHHAYFDPFGGYLKARESCQLVRDTFIKEGGTFILSSITPGTIKGNRLQFIESIDGSRLRADAYVFACGSWLNNIFPQVLSTTITSSKQEVYYFGVPRQCAKAFNRLPVWVDVDGKDFYYGIPFNDDRGFKIGVDKRGEAFDPTNDGRTLNSEVLADARKFISHRFPALSNAPLLENRVCPYENSPDGNFIIDHHPEAENVLIVGGGSGHGFKHGPAVGELVRDGLTEGRRIPGLFSLKRFR
jgi:glycine/D-amino acid oxidase-like deaminating enzyme